MTATFEFANEDAEALWSSVVQRDHSRDGSFVYGVASTGVYCRPSCPSKRPLRKYVRFFPSAANAEAAGYRACLRCEPEQVTRTDQLVAHVLKRLESEDEDQTLDNLGELLGVGASSLQRIFKRATGVTPLQYARAVKTERLSRKLRTGQSVTRALYEAGFDSSNALYRRTGDLLGMTPGRYRNGGNGETIRYTFLDTDLGRTVVAATERGVCALRFGVDADTRTELQREYPRAQHIEDPEGLALVVAGVRERIAGLTNARPLDLDIEATAFQRLVWQALRKIPVGETRSYRQVAEEIGSPNAARAVARACALNPVALVIPCHRVIRATGTLSGYRWGTDRKKALLTRECLESGSDHPPKVHTHPSQNHTHFEEER